MNRIISLIVTLVMILTVSAESALAWKRPIRVRNSTTVPIKVQLDHRESINIDPAGTGRLEKANNGDNPTLHIYVNGQTNEAFSERLGILAGFGTLKIKWTGSKLEEDEN